jgi:NitT/TauT family transport system substrate-binding protein
MTTIGSVAAITAARRTAGMVMGAALLAASLTGLAACAGGSGDGADGGPVTLRLGYFPNLTHATPIVGVEKGIFAEALGADVKLESTTFNAGPAAVEALFSGAIDATYIGPNPAINAYARSRGAAVRVVAGAASGGVFLVVKPGINSAEDLRGKVVATPQLGNTQDVALRFWLKERGLATTAEGGGDVQIKPQDNAVTVDAFNNGAIDGAWVPEPTASRLVAGGGKVLVDERTLWPDGRFVITHLLVSKEFLDEHPDVVRDLIAGSVAANDFITANPTEARQAVSDGIGRLTGKPLDLELVGEAWKSIEFLNDPIPSSLLVGAEHAQAAGLLKPVDNLEGLYDLTLLNQVLKERGQPEVLL